MALSDSARLYTDIIRDELNVKEVKVVDDMSALSSYSFKPNLKTVGPKYGKLLGKIRTVLQNDDFDGNAAMAELKSTGVLNLDLGGENAALEEGDLLIEVKQKEGFFTVNDNGVTVALDTTLTDELIAEGFVRELISKVQTMRKEAGFVVTDHIAVSVCGSEKVESIVKASPDELTSSVLCDKLVFEEKIDSDLEKEWDINGENVTISVKKL